MLYYNLPPPTPPHYILHNLNFIFLFRSPFGRKQSFDSEELSCFLLMADSPAVNQKGDN